MGVVLHRLVIRDLRSVLAFYTEEVGPRLANQFYEEFERVVSEGAENPQRFHRVEGELRRANLHRFPYHLPYRESAAGVRILVLRHHRRELEFGIERR